MHTCVPLIVCCLVFLTARSSASPKKSCQPAENCKFGYEFAGGCRRCLTGLGETCGGQVGADGKCAEGLYCEISRSAYGTVQSVVTPVGPLNPNPTGTCRYMKDLLDCPTTCYQKECHQEICINGIAKSPCGCCDVCLPGAGDDCGNFTPCASGYHCDMSYPKPGQLPGTCKIWHPMELVIANTYGGDPSIHARYGIAPLLPSDNPVTNYTKINQGNRYTV